MEQKIHQGRNVKRFRENAWNQTGSIGFDLGEHWNQKKISHARAKKIIEDNFA
jgi:hypothetical protein